MAWLWRFAAFRAVKIGAGKGPAVNSRSFHELAGIGGVILPFQAARQRPLPFAAHESVIRDIGPRIGAPETSGLRQYLRKSELANSELSPDLLRKTAKLLELTLTPAEE